MSTELPADKVIVQASATGMTPKFFSEFYDWDTLYGSPGTNDSMKFEIDRTSPKKAFVKIFDRNTGDVVVKMYVWVVWADGSIARTGATYLTPFDYDKTNGGTPTKSALFTTSSPPHCWKFSFAIQPASIIADANSGQDAPQLSGLLPQGTYVPGDSGEHPVMGYDSQTLSGGKFKYGASHYWDVSRQMKITVVNPGLIPWSDLSEGFHDLYNTQQPNPQATSIPIPFPTDPDMGNDDVGFPNAIALDESNDPYVPITDAGNSLAHGIGEITSLNFPKCQITNAAGVQGRQYEELDNFREFARLNLQGGWFSVSDYVGWQFEMKVEFNAGKWQDHGSFPIPTP